MSALVSGLRKEPTEPEQAAPDKAENNAALFRSFQGQTHVGKTRGRSDRLQFKSSPGRSVSAWPSWGSQGHGELLEPRACSHLGRPQKPGGSFALAVGSSVCFRTPGVGKPEMF